MKPFRHFIFLITAALALLATPCAQTPEQPTISGLYEICVGVTDPLPQIRYWETLGYRVGPIGELSAAEAKKLYGVDSRLRSIRLLQQDSEHGLIRLLVWDKPINEGLGLAKMLAPGARWTSTLTRDVMQLYNHAEAAQRAKQPISLVPPQWSEIYKIAAAEPFTGEVIGVRELIVLTPLTRHMFFERFGYEVPKYGKINEAAKFKTSQVTHSGLVFQSDDPTLADFYSEVLGLQTVTRENRWTAEQDEGTRNLYGMKAGDYYFGTTVDDPRSVRGPTSSVSGRLLLRRIPTALKEENLMARSRPGSLGYSLYTYRVTALESYHAKVKASKATGVTEIMKNEFGEKSFSFYAPDGHFWTLVGK